MLLSSSRAFLHNGVIYVIPATPELSEKEILGLGVDSRGTPAGERNHFGVILGSFWDHFGIILGSFWSHFGKSSLGGTWHGRLGEPGGADPGEPGGTTDWTQHIKNESKNPISRA